MGLTYGPLGTVLSELFPTAVRYTGSSLTFNLAGIFGASLAPYIATWLAEQLRPAVRRLLPDRGRAADARRPAGDARNEGRARSTSLVGKFEGRISRFEVKFEVPFEPPNSTSELGDKWGDAVHRDGAGAGRLSSSGSSASTVVFTETCMRTWSVAAPEKLPDTGITPRGWLLTPVTMWLSEMRPRGRIESAPAERRQVDLGPGVGRRHARPATRCRAGSRWQNAPPLRDAAPPPSSASPCRGTIRVLSVSVGAGLCTPFSSRR